MAKPTKNESGTSVPKSKVNIALFASLIIVVLALVCVVLYFLKNPQILTKKELVSATQRDVLITPENVSQIMAELESKNPDSRYTATMPVEWYFSDGQSTAAPNGDKFFVENAVENSRPVYFDLIVSPTNEAVYSSPVIPIGSRLEAIRLSKELAKGDYDAVVVYHLLDDDQRELSTASLAVTLHILN